MLTITEFILRTRVKYVVLGLTCLFFLTVVLSGNGDHSHEELVLDRLNQEIVKVRDLKERLRTDPDIVAPSPGRVGVRFYSGRSAVKEVDNEKRTFQRHTVTIINMELVKVVLRCQDPFSKFGSVLTPSASYSFSVTDLFSKRHYWCRAKFAVNEFVFRAYGEGAPRDNNVIYLHKDGAYINGLNYRIDGGYVADDEGHGDGEGKEEHLNLNKTGVVEVKEKNFSGQDKEAVEVGVKDQHQPESNDKTVQDKHLHTDMPKTFQEGVNRIETARTTMMPRLPRRRHPDI